MDKSVKFRIELETKGEKVFHDIRVDAEDFQQAVQEVNSEVRKMGHVLDGMAHAGLVFTAAKDAVDALHRAVSGLADEYNTFDKGMRSVGTMAGGNAKELSALKDEVEALSHVVPLAKEELAQGLYQVISNGVPKDNWISFLEKSSRSAVGGIADLGETVTVTSTIIKNYGLEWEAAGNLQDKIQMTARNGVTSFEQLASALPRVTGNAASLGVGIDELMASFATLTGVSGNTAEVSTQLGSIFSALVKPSSEAAAMAEQMGIQFDAAAIRAAGGMQNFLTMLTMNVQQYAAAHGVLEQEIMGRLFGSAEAVRALIPLTGELADTFDANIAAMAESEGTIDAAFDQMAGSGEAVTMMLKNQLGTMMEWVGSMASGISPYLEFVAVGGQAMYGLGMIAAAAKKAATSISALSVVQKQGAVATALAAMHEKVQTVVLNLLTSSSYTATAGTWALTAAVTALYAAATLGVSLVITGLVSLFSDTGEEAEKAAGKVDVLKASTDALRHAAGNAKAEIDVEISSLRNLITTQGEESEMVERLNRKYGKVMGNHATATEWYNTLIRKSKAYCMQLGYEAQAKVLASELAAKELEREEKQRMQRELGGQNLMADGKIKYTWELKGLSEEDYRELGTDVEALTGDIDRLKVKYDAAIRKMADGSRQLAAGLSDTSKAVDWQKSSYDDLGKAIEQQKVRVAQLAGVDETRARKEAATLQEMEKRYSALGKEYGLLQKSASGGIQYNGKELIAGAKSYKALANNIAYYQNQLESTDASDQKTINTLKRKINALQEEQKALQEVLETAGRPAELRTLEDIDKELAYQREVRRRASAERLQGLDEEIKRLQELKRRMEESAHVAVGVEQIDTYDELEREIAFYENKLKHATATERIEISHQIKELKRLKGQWDAVLESVDAPDVDKLDTLGELEEAIAYYDARMKRATASEIWSLQKTKLLLDEKRESLQRLSEIPSLQREAADLGNLGNGELKLELELIGLDGVKEKLRHLQKMLDDVENPLDESQRKEVMRLMDTWQGYEKELRRSQVTLGDAWGTMRSLGGSIGSITGALEGNGSAWEKVVGVMDGMIGIYDGIQGVIQIIEMLTGITTAHTAAKTAEAAATVASTTAEGAGAVTSEVAAAAQIPVIAGNKAATASFLELASAAYFAAHAYIPFAGFGIASGFAAAAVAETKAIGAMPFADGGVVYGPTLGLIGEYAGASGNPEVVAPLDKLKSLIGGSDGGGMDGKVEFKIKGRRLAGVLEKEYRHRKRNQ